MHQQRTRRRLRRLAGAAAVLLAAGCGAGQVAQTYQERAVADATNTAVGTVAVRNLAVPSPPTGISYAQGSSAPVQLALVNDGDDDVLLSASTPAARSVQIVGPTSTIPIPRLGTADPAYSLRLRDLTAALPSGTYVDLTLTFARNGVASMLVPVQVNPQDDPSPSSAAPSAEAGQVGEAPPDEGASEPGFGAAPTPASGG